jgi:hypothetical protein
MSRYRINQKLRIRVNRMNRVLGQNIKATPSSRSLPDLSKYDTMLIKIWDDSKTWQDTMYWIET